MKVLSVAMIMALTCGAAVAAAPVFTTKAQERAHPEQIQAPDAGGTCGTPTTIASTPYTDNGTTVGGASTVNALSAGCSNYTTVNGADTVYTFHAGTGAALTLTLTPTTATYDPALYILSTCGTGTTCVKGSDAALAGDPETFATPALTAGNNYFVYVDSFYSTTNACNCGTGTYTLDITGTLPVELSGFSVE